MYEKLLVCFRVKYNFENSHLQGRLLDRKKDQKITKIPLHYPCSVLPILHNRDLLRKRGPGDPRTHRRAGHEESEHEDKNT